MKYVCPKCGGRLIYWSEFLYEERQVVNPKTGELYSKKVKTKPEELDNMFGLKCENDNCDFLVNLATDVLPKEIEHFYGLTLPE